jgi:hypothetical protein
MATVKFNQCLVQGLHKINGLEKKKHVFQNIFFLRTFFMGARDR